MWETSVLTNSIEVFFDSYPQLKSAFPIWLAFLEKQEENDEDKENFLLSLHSDFSFSDSNSISTKVVWAASVIEKF